jgi:hypothetical protein
MLVTLVLVSLVGLIVSQAMLQIARVERLLEGVQLRGMAASLHAEWTRNALAGLLPGEAGSAERFAGDAQSLQGISTAVPQWPDAGLTPVRMSLRYVEQTRRTELLLQTQVLRSDVPAATAAEAPVVLLRWEGRAGRWRYLDREGNWQERWPVPMAEAGPRVTALPAAIALETGDPTLGTLIAVPLAADESQMPTRQRMEKM